MIISLLRGDDDIAAAIMVGGLTIAAGFCLAIGLAARCLLWFKKLRDKKTTSKKQTSGDVVKAPG